MTTPAKNTSLTKGKTPAAKNAPKALPAPAVFTGVINTPPPAANAGVGLVSFGGGITPQPPITLTPAPAPAAAKVESMQIPPEVLLAADGPKKGVVVEKPTSAKGSGKKWADLAILVLILAVIGFIGFFGFKYLKKPVTTFVEDREKTQLREELNLLRQEREASEANEALMTPESPIEVPAPEVEKPKEIRYIKALPVEEQPSCPKVVRWIENGSYLVPVRQMPDGVAGYGPTYEIPPNGGGVKPKQAWAEKFLTSTDGWTRNERGDWAIPLQR